MRLELRGLEKRYGDFRLRLDASIGSGEFVSLLGPSGSGKSTALSLIAGLIPADSGRILAEGRDIGSLPPERRGIGLVFQDYALFPHMSVRGNVEYGLAIRGMGARARRTVSDGLLRRFGIASLADRRIDGLSGGERQRTALARSLAVDPLALLMDEPLSSVDEPSRKAIGRELKSMLEGVTVIHVTHDSRSALELSDRIILIKDGSIVQEGPPAELCEAPASAFAARFLGSGPCIPILSIERGDGRAMVETALGKIECPLPPGGEPGGAFLFFPSWAWREDDAGPFEAEIVGSSYAKVSRELIMARGLLSFELSAPPDARYAPGRTLRFRPRACRLLSE